MQNWVDLQFADGTYEFRLGLSQINEIERKCDAGIGEVFSRLLQGRYVIGGENIGAPAEARYRMCDIVEPIRQGLIGGGKGIVDGEQVKVSSARANELVTNYVISGQIAEAWTIAVAVMSALIQGYDPGPKDEPAQEPATESTQGSITPEPSSTAP